jgi:hypothetical protein
MEATMKFFPKLLLGLSSGLLLSSAFAEIPNHNTSITPLLGPTLKMSTTSFINDISAFSLAGELGVRDIRASGTYGWAIASDQRVKFTVEALSQELKYSFFSGNDDQWVWQGAIGADYVHDFTWNMWNWQSSFELNAYYSHAPSKDLQPINNLLIHPRHIPFLVDVQRRIAGSNAFGITPGLILGPWVGTTITAQLNYDDVIYDTKNMQHTTANGLGATFILDQWLNENFALKLEAAIRKPFTEYFADIYYQNMQFMGRWNFGIFGDYVNGKAQLPNSWNLGIHADYFFDPCVRVDTPMNLKGERNLKGEASYLEVRNPDPFVTWVGDPAVRMPQVLAIADPLNQRTCMQGKVKVIHPIANITTPIPASVITNVPTAQAFSGTGLTFTVTGADANDTVLINATTGVVSIEPTAPLGQTVLVTVTATNLCGTATTSFTALVEGITQKKQKVVVN